MSSYRTPGILALAAALIGATLCGVSMAQEPHGGGRPEGGHSEGGPRPSAPAPHPAAPQPGFRGAPPPAAHYDGRGQVLDSRYNHGRYYAPVGTVARTLPGEYRAYYHRGAPYYFSGGVWYAPRGPGFVVVAPPFGLSIAVLPPYYSTLWVGGVPYYYADNVYYTAAPDQSGYVVAPPPDDGQGQGQGGPPPDADGDPNAPGPGAAPGGAYPQAPPQAQPPSDFIIYPKQGQSKDQQAADQYECHNWARGQTGFDPTQPNGGVANGGDADRAHSNYDRAMAACLQGRGYQVN